MWQHSAGHIPQMFTLLSQRLFLGHALGKTWGKCQKYITLTMFLHSSGKPHHAVPQVLQHGFPKAIFSDYSEAEIATKLKGWGSKAWLSWLEIHEV